MIFSSALSATDSTGPLSGLLTSLKSLLVAMYDRLVEGGNRVWLPGDTSGSPKGYFGLDLPALFRRIFFCLFRLSARRMLSQSNS